MPENEIVFFFFLPKFLQPDVKNYVIQIRIGRQRVLTLLNTTGGETMIIISYFITVLVSFIF